MAMATEVKMEIWHRIDSRAIKCKIMSVQKPPNQIRNARDYEILYMRKLEQFCQHENHGKVWDELNIVINSAGGSAESAIGLLGALYRCRKMKKMKTRILIDGICGSAATYIACGMGKKVPVYITPGSKYFIHNPKTEVFHRMRGGIWESFFKAGSKQLTRDMVNMYHSRTKVSKKVIRQWMNEGKYFTAEEAVRVGFADKVLSAHDFYWW